MIKIEFEHKMFVPRITSIYMKNNFPVFKYEGKEYYIYNDIVLKKPKIRRNIERHFDSKDFEKNFKLVNYQNETILLIKKG